MTYNRRAGRYILLLLTYFVGPRFRPPPGQEIDANTGNATATV